MPTINFITPEQHKADMQALRNEFLGLLNAYVQSRQQWLTREQALEVSGIKTRETLEKYARASAPDKEESGRITWRKQGSKCRYALTSCIDYAQRKLGQPALAA